MVADLGQLKGDANILFDQIILKTKSNKSEIVSYGIAHYMSKKISQISYCVKQQLQPVQRVGYN